MQTDPRKRRRRSAGAPALGAALFGLALPPATAQDAPASGGFRLSPLFSASESYLETRSSTNGNNGHESVTVLSPGLRLSSRSGRLQGSLDYTGNLYVRAGLPSDAGHDFQNGLNAAFLAEAVPGWAFIDASATVSQQAISAFGQQSVDGSLQANANRTEVSTFSISPYVRGDMGRFVDYEVRVGATGTRTRADAAADTHGTNAAVTLSSPSTGAMLGWALNATQQRSTTRAADGSSNIVDDSRAYLTVTVTPAPEVRLSANGGRESADAGAQAARSQVTTSGLGLVWNPSPRTSLSANGEERYFGRTNNVAFSHRSARTVWSYTLTRDTNTNPASTSYAQPTTLYQLYYNRADMVQAYPDPAQRDQVVRNQLAAQGLDPNQFVSIGFLTAGQSIQRRQDVSVAWLGQRDSINVQAFTTSVSQIITIGSAAPVTGEPTVQHGYSSMLTHRLTPDSSISMGGSRTMTFGTSTQTGNDLKSAFMTFTSQLGRRTSAQLGARYTVFNSDTDPYRTTSVTASISLRF